MILISIKGIGPKAISSIMAARKNGPFIDEADFESRVNKRVVNSRVRNLLNITYCWTNKKDLELTESQLDYLNDFFNFSLSNDPMYKYRKLLNKIRTCIDIKNISGSSAGDIVWGYVDKITYQIKTDGEDGIAYSGCYGQLKDEKNNYIMMNFERDLYKIRKDDIEHSEGKWVAVRLSNKRDDSLTVNQIWYADDMLKGKFQNFEYFNNREMESINFAQYSNLNISILNEPLNNNTDSPKNIKSCKMCDLRNECLSPVIPSVGNQNVMIIGESPNKSDNDQGLALFNNIIWDGEPSINVLGLSDFSISRNDIWATSFVKCWPSASKKPKKKHINKCTLWLEKEMKALRPFLILAMGNAGLSL